MKRLFLFALVSFAVFGCTSATENTTSTSPDAGVSDDSTATDGGLAVVEKVEPDAVAGGHAAKSNDAEVIFADALKLASSDDKRVLVHLGAPW